MSYRCSDDKTKQLLEAIIASRRLFMVPAEINGNFNIRYCVIAERMEARHIQEAWDLIEKTATRILLAA